MRQVPLTKDWSSFYQEGKHHDEEVLLANSYKNSMKSELNLVFMPRRHSVRKRNGIRWRDVNDVFVDERDFTQ